VNVLQGRGNLFTVYVLVSAGGRRYTGYTSDLPRRLNEHNSGLCKTTKADQHWRTVHAELHLSQTEAKKA
ncbi:hypothetical protein GF420_01080, partial [candidate division GN15 bacterium]|nr:hypothetical protein [candidate division GN15 bacterium]